tara:strand:+ start:7502 stop:7705 length:204 start_codon:yes stop_codon:yes gene_type:complete
MIGLYSQLLSKDQKMIVKDALIMYVCQLQKQYFRDNVIPMDEYHRRMADIDEITEKLHLKDLYKHDS